MGRPKKDAPKKEVAPKEKGKRGRPKKEATVVADVVESKTEITIPEPEVVVSSITPVEEVSEPTITEAPVYSEPMGIAPIEEDLEPAKVENKPMVKSTEEEHAKLVATPAEEFYSDYVFRIIGKDSVKFLRGDVEIPTNSTVQRIKETVFRFICPNIEEPGKMDVTDLDFGASSSLLEAQLKLYEKGLGKNNQATPLESEVKTPAPLPEPSPVSTIDEMKYSAAFIEKAIMSTTVVRLGRKIPTQSIEDMLKKEDKRFSYELRNDGAGYFITVSSVGNKVRIPENEAEFLPVQ